MLKKSGCSWVVAVLWLGVLSVLLTGCQDESPSSSAPVESTDAQGDAEQVTLPIITVAGDPVVATGGRLLDALGRELVLRGFNARVEGLFDVTFDDGRTALQPIPVFTGEDCRVLAETLGQNLLRLPVNWSGMEPKQGEFNQASFDRMLEVIRGCWEHGVYNLVDIHQDAYSKEIGEDGAPLWAIVPEPTELLEGPLTEEELAERRLSPQVLAAFESLYENKEGVQDAYATMAAKLAEVIRDEPGVMGIDLMNEPVVLKDLDPTKSGLLDAFHVRVSEAIREVAPAVTLVFEPNSIRNFTDAWAVAAPFPFDDAVYSPHVYTDVFTDGWANRDIEKLQQSIIASEEEANDHGTPLLIGEYGNSPVSETGLLWLETALAQMDAEGASGAVWLYEEQSQGSWGLYDAVGGERGEMRDAFAALISRPFPQAVDGKLVQFSFDMASKVLTVEVEEAGSGEHILSAPAVLYPDGVEVRCDGAVVDDAVSYPGRVGVVCTGTELTMRPAASE